MAAHDLTVLTFDEEAAQGTTYRGYKVDGLRNVMIHVDADCWLTVGRTDPDTVAPAADSRITWPSGLRDFKVPASGVGGQTGVGDMYIGIAAKAGTVALEIYGSGDNVGGGANS